MRQLGDFRTSSLNIPIKYTLIKHDRARRQNDPDSPIVFLVSL